MVVITMKLILLQVVAGLLPLILNMVVCEKESILFR